MQTINLKLVKKNQFEYQIKNGRKVLDKIQSVSDGKWAAGFQVFEYLDQAVEYARQLIESQANAFGGNILVTINTNI